MNVCGINTNPSHSANNGDIDTKITFCVLINLHTTIDRDCIHTNTTKEQPQKVDRHLWITNNNYPIAQMTYKNISHSFKTFHPQPQKKAKSWMLRPRSKPHQKLRIIKAVRLCICECNACMHVCLNQHQTYPYKNAQKYFRQFFDYNKSERNERTKTS